MIADAGPALADAVSAAMRRLSTGGLFRLCHDLRRRVGDPAVAQTGCDEVECSVCNLYSMTAAREAILRLFRISANRAAAVDPLGAVFPGHAAPVVRRAPDGERELSMLSWGFVLPQKDKAPRRVTNVRDDKALSSPFWRDSFRHRRCLVPVTSFAEPREVTPATWHWFALAGIEPRPLFAFAGIWRRWVGPVRNGGDPVEIDVFAFMTTRPNALVATINHERMPVLLTTDADRDRWLDGAPEEAFALATPHPAERLRMVRSGFDKTDGTAGS